MAQKHDIGKQKNQARAIEKAQGRGPAVNRRRNVTQKPIDWSILHRPLPDPPPPREEISKSLPAGQAVDLRCIKVVFPSDTRWGEQDIFYEISVTPNELRKRLVSLGMVKPSDICEFKAVRARPALLANTTIVYRRIYLFINEGKTDGEAKS